MDIYTHKPYTHTHAHPSRTSHQHARTHKHTQPNTQLHMDTPTNIHASAQTIRIHTYTQNHPPKHLTVTHPLSRYL